MSKLVEHAPAPSDFVVRNIAGNKSKDTTDGPPGYMPDDKLCRRHDRFTPLIKTPKEILAMDIVKFKAPPPMSGPTEYQNKNKLCEFHGDKGHNTDELKDSTQKLLKREKPLGKKKLQKYSWYNHEDDDERNSPMVVETELGVYLVHRMYVDGGSASEVLYEHCFNRLRPEVKKRMTPAITSLLGFSGESPGRWDKYRCWYH
ncbi:hypothetical protein Tco_1293675 [Tanacetum coccineum]